LCLGGRVLYEIKTCESQDQDIKRLEASETETPITRERSRRRVETFRRHTAYKILKDLSNFFTATNPGNNCQYR